MSVKKLNYKKLGKEYQPTKFKFDDTSQIDPLYNIIGQDRAVRSLQFGLTIKTRGYNIYMSGKSGTGKTSYAMNYIKKMANKAKIPDDWCYVYNFDKANQPTAINLPAGTGKVFKQDMEEFVKILQLEISKAFDSEDYERERSLIVQEFQGRRNELLEQLGKDAEKQGFKVKTTSTGIYFLPVVEGKAINEQEYGELDEEIKHGIDEKTNLLQLETIDIMRKIKNIEREAEERVSEWENKIALFAVGMHINDLKEKYEKYEKLPAYLDKIQEDILSNLDDFRDDDVGEEQQVSLPWAKKNEESPVEKYKVNLFIDNSGLKGAPIIVDHNPTYYNLLGKLEYENEFGSMSTDYTMIKNGLLHQANGGYLILQIKDVLNSVQCWEALKRAIRTKEIAIENMKEQMGLSPLSTIKPEPIPLDIKVILVGSEYIYHVLFDNDEDFSKLFKIKVDFDDEMDKTDGNVMKLAQFISAFCRREEEIHFDKSGVAKVIDYSSKLVENQNKLSTKFNDIVEILSESCAWAHVDGSDIVNSNHVNTAMAEKRFRSSKHDDRLLQYLQDGTIIIDTKNEVIGQINGLTILDMGDFSFGKPARITANTFVGKKGIVNIEREIEMSGTSHTKGILILSGYLGQKFAQDMPLSLTASVCFEQLYNGVDGDSASCAELYAVLSSLSEVPIKQSIAVTGSVNQKGEIQPIGGATEKIEGFFELCKSRGLDGTHGAIIPYQNIKNLVLCDEVVEACKNEEFSIYAVKNIDEGIEILTGVKAGIKDKNGEYPVNSINYKVHEKLRKFAMTSVGYGKPSIE